MTSVASLILVTVLATVLNSGAGEPDAQVIVVEPASPIYPARPPVHHGGSFGSGHGHGHGHGFGHASHGPIEKRGRCPRSSGFGGISVCRYDPNRRNCLMDGNCHGNMKCCNDACGKICKYPAFF